MQNDVMTDKFIDYVNDRIEDLDMTKSSLARSVGLDKNSVTKYLKKERTMPLHVALKIANYLNMDISRICGIQTEQVDVYKRQVRGRGHIWHHGEPTGVPADAVGGRENPSPCPHHVEDLSLIHI